ncbi:hypothetical protein [Chitinophaga dinghuensis]|uniref:hypothetical protein n=1 Tax=Chitinophaga dinghuensis TaxID=1539050 RepID=UPI0011B94328|nr:hypothetical protein [Chitinophaga dinghuensis]
MGNTSLSEQRLKILDSVVSFKVAYERSLNKAEYSSGLEADKKAYYNALHRLKSAREEVSGSINLLLADTSYGIKEMVSFTFVDPLSSYISPCALISRRELLKLTLYNLKYISSDSAFVCPGEHR